MTAIWSKWSKSPGDVDWYEFDWSGTDSVTGAQWLPDGVTIDSYVLTVDANLTKLTDQLQGARVQFKVSGGTDLGEAEITCRISTSDDNTYETTKTIYVNTRTS